MAQSENGRQAIESLSASEFGSMDTRRINYRGSRIASSKPQNVLRLNPARHGIVEPTTMVSSVDDSPFLTQVLVLPPGLPVDIGSNEGPCGTIVVSPMKESKGDEPQEPVAKCDGIGGGSNNGGSGNRNSNNGDHGGLFDNLGPNPSLAIKTLRLFHEIGIEFRNGAVSMRQVGKRFDERDRNNEYPEGLPCGHSGANRGRRDILDFFRKLFALDEEPPIFTCDPTNRKTVTGLTDFGWSLWAKTQSFLMSCGIIKKAA